VKLMRLPSLSAGAAALALSAVASAAPLSDTTKTALSGKWAIDMSDPASKGETAEMLARYAFATTLTLGGGYSAGGLGGGCVWLPVTAAVDEGESVKLLLPGGDAIPALTIAMTGPDTATFTRKGESFAFTRVRPAEPMAAADGFEAVAVRLTQPSSLMRRFVKMNAQAEDTETACADETRAALEFDLLSPVGHSVMVKQDLDIQGWAIRTVIPEPENGTVTLSVAKLMADPPPAEDWTISGMNQPGPITLMPSGDIYADCTGPLN